MLLAVTVPAIWFMAYATQYWHFLVIGLFVGLAGGSFSVGTPYVARWFPKERQGFAMGVFGAGNSGAAVNKFIAPALVVGFRLDHGAAGLRRHHAGYALCCSGCSATATRRIWCPAHTKFSDQLKMLKDPQGAQVLPVLLASSSAAMWR